jgi:hypothetical protein
MKSQDYNKGYIAGLRCAKRYLSDNKTAHQAINDKIAKLKRKSAPRHKIGNVWRNKKEHGGEAIYQPMEVVGVGISFRGYTTEDGVVIPPNHVTLRMSDGEDWALDELKDAGWRKAQ